MKCKGKQHPQETRVEEVKDENRNVLINNPLRHSIKSGIKKGRTNRNHSKKP